MGSNLYRWWWCKHISWTQIFYDFTSMWYQESKTVPSAIQQKLKMPFVSNQNCIEKFRTFGVNLENDIRFVLVCYLYLHIRINEDFLNNNIAVLTNICVLVGRRGKTVVRWNSILLTIKFVITYKLHAGRQWWSFDCTKISIQSVHAGWSCVWWH